MAVELPIGIDVSKFTPEQLSRIQELIKDAKGKHTYKALSDKICELHPEESLQVLCDTVKEAEEKIATKEWAKTVISAVKKQMKVKKIEYK